MDPICQFGNFAADEIAGESFHDLAFGTPRVQPTRAIRLDAMLIYGTELAAERLVKLSVMG